MKDHVLVTFTKVLRRTYVVGNTREASVMNAMYEKKLALQAESYMQLKIAYEELSQVMLAAGVSTHQRSSSRSVVLPRRQWTFREDSESFLRSQELFVDASSVSNGSEESSGGSC